MVKLLRAIKVIWLSLGALVLTVGFAFASDAANCSTSVSPKNDYTIRLCITAPADGAVATGDVTVSATVEEVGQSPGVRSLEFFLGNAHLLTDYVAPFTFMLPSTHFIDGSRKLSVQATMRDDFATTSTSIQLQFKNNVTVVPVSTTKFKPTSGTTPADGQPFIMAATGDGASGETPEVPALIASWSPNLFLYLGDVYEEGTYTEFYNWYAPDEYFGQFRAITDPIIGNHEYTKGKAYGYQDYWNTRHDDQVYYSFNANGWHFIALNANGQVGQQPGSLQYAWLLDDLNRNTAACTLAYWHQPLFSVGPEPKSDRMERIWALLARYHVDIVLSGHDHGYQRWQPLDGSGKIDPVNGITEFVAAGGGHGIQQFIASDNRMAVGYDTAPLAFGALRFVLNSKGATYDYVNTAGTVLDAGTITCHGAQDDQKPPTVPAGFSAHVDDNANVVLNWSSATDNLGVSGYTLYRDGQVLTTTTRSELTYTDTDVALGQSYTYTVDAVNSSNIHSPQSPSASVTLPTQTTQTFTSTADSFIDSSNPDTNYGVSTALRADLTPDVQSLIRFNVEGFPHGNITQATLRIFSNLDSLHGFDLFTVPENNWNETTITYRNAPSFGRQLEFVASLNANSWATVDVTPIVIGNGIYSFGLKTTSPTALSFSSREGSNAPQLIIQASS